MSFSRMQRALDLREVERRLYDWKYGMRKRIPS